MSLFINPSDRTALISEASNTFPLVITPTGSFVIITSEGFEVKIKTSRSSLAIQVFDTYEKTQVFQHVWLDVSLATVNEVYGYALLWSDSDFDEDGFVTLQDLIDFNS